MIYVVLFIFALISVSIATISKSNSDNKKLTDSKSDQNKWIVENNLNPTVDFSYNNLLDRSNVRFMVDEKSRNIIVSEGHIIDNEAVTSKPVLISFDNILGCEIREDSAVTGGVGRALVGGALAGDAGAIVGVLTAKKQIHSFEIAFLTNNIQKPQFVITLIGSFGSKGCPKNGLIYTNAVDFSNRVVATIKAIIAQKENMKVVR
ncbi:hypothetical protein [uncultured Oscillibacter sp.]|uniref:hypothetical protein n=1 Tax=uncultured Oscillibacter sp. TaxID=876091 RepID=UPI0025FBFC77|nr:hypothetical protein [uncultured Oscillibacter sp.]